MENKVVSLANPGGAPKGLSAEDFEGDAAILRKFYDLGNEYYRKRRDLSNSDAMCPYWNAGHWHEPGYTNRLRYYVASQLRLLSKYCDHDFDAIIDMQYKLVESYHWPNKDTWTSGESVEWLGTVITLGFLASREERLSLRFKTDQASKKEENNVQGE
jgi:hypothetical protein